MLKATIMHYFSTVRGITEVETGQPTVYYGKIHRIPHDQLQDPEKIQAAALVEVERLMEAVTMDGTKFPVNGIVERYEVFDPETGDILVMHRIPYQDLAKPNPAPKKPYRRLD